MSGTSIYCPYCQQHTALSVAPTSNHYSERQTPAIWQPYPHRRWWIGICNYCKQPVLVLNEGEIIYPTPLPSPTDERIPEEIRINLIEAKSCWSVGAHNACATMARRAIQVACLDKGAAKSDNLVTQINHLASTGIITNDLKEWAHTVRWIGNDGAHPSEDVVTKEDAEEALHLAEQLMYVLYVAPAIAREQMRKRNKTV